MLGPALLLQQNETVGVQAAKDALEDHSKLLLRRFDQLERDAASLQDGNDTLTQQVHALAGMKQSQRVCQRCRRNHSSLAAAVLRGPLSRQDLQLMHSGAKGCGSACRVYIRVVSAAV